MILLASIYLIVGLLIVGALLSVVDFFKLTTLNKFIFLGVCLFVALTWPITITSFAIMNIKYLTPENFEKLKEKIWEMWH